MKDRVLSLLSDVANPSFRTAVYVGLVSIPFTVALSFETIATTSTDVSVGLGPVAIASLITGYLYATRATESWRAGLITGLLGTIPFVVHFLLWSAVVAPGTALPWPVLTIAVLGVAVLVLGLTAVISILAAMVGVWIRTSMLEAEPSTDSA